MVNTWQEDLQWYRTHQTTSQIGFNPDGMCLKVCRTSRGVGPKYLTAKQCQDAVPAEHRFTRVRDLRKGMKLFFDRVGDSNTAGHIVTMIGRVKGFDWDDLNDVLVETNSVKSGELVVVRATYFIEHWGDPFVFGSDWINGVEIDYAGKERQERRENRPEKDTAPRVENFRQSGNEWNVNILDRAVSLGGRRDIKPKIAEIEAAVKALPDDEDDSRVKQFKDRFKEDRVLEMKLLNDAVAEGRVGEVKAGRDRLRTAIKSVLRH